MMIQHPHEKTVVNLDQVAEFYVYVNELVFVFADGGIDEEHWLFHRQELAYRAFERICVGVRDGEPLVHLRMY